MLDKNPNYRDQFITCFCNTGKERIETLEFVHQVETRWEVPVTWLEYERCAARSIPDGIFPTARRNQNLQKAKDADQTTHWFQEVDYTSASRRGEPFDKLLEWMGPLPNVVSRACSMQLKIRTAMRYLFFRGFKEYASHIGIRHDESMRSIQILAHCDPFEHPTFPLIEERVSEMDVLDFWKTNDFDLQLESYEGNCDLCFLKAKWKRVRLVRENPTLVHWWKDWEKKKKDRNARAGSVFRQGESYTDIEQIAQGPTQTTFDLNDYDIPCSCAEKGFAPDEEADIPAF
jgi:3'-phosphoadenosine 5'-phosphosulfate sulfotransferase (PAPS reductase)/FAD synthetase